MTTATKLNTTKLLSQLAISKSSGCLELDGESVCWKIYLQEGQLKYIYCSVQSLDQLKYYLRYLGWKKPLKALKKLKSSDLDIKVDLEEISPHKNLYSQVICWLLSEEDINSSQGLKLLEQISKDCLSSFLWVDSGIVSWQEEYSLPFWIKVKLGNPPSLNLIEYIEVEKTRFKQWHNCSDRLLSVHQCLYFAANWQQKPLPSSGVLDENTLQGLTQVIRGNINIRQLSLILQKDELKVAKILSPYIEEKIIILGIIKSPLDRLPNIPRLKKNIELSDRVVSSTDTPNKSSTLQVGGVKKCKIICIDDSPTILQEIRRFLDPQRFEVTAIDNPVQAVPIIFRLEPDLILLDITMPIINGYKLCDLLRNSDRCNKTPIIMVTGNTGLIDKARAKLVGATDYFTKPFTKQSLNDIVAKYIQ